VLRSARGRVYTNVDQVPAHHVALVLGTSPTVGWFANPFFEYRMDAAAALYHAGKARYLLLSGDHGRKEYNEPAEMRQALVKRGVPCEAMVLDYAGFRTLDSVARAKTVFGQQRLLIVSQEFHNYRAVFLARRHGIDASAFNAHGVSASYGFKTHAREWFARAAAVADVLVGRRPRFYGPRIEIPPSPGSAMAG
jgi:SanA protein